MQPGVPPSSRTTWAVVGIAMLAAVLAYANTLGHAFVYDDALLLAEPRVQGFDRWREILTAPFFSSAANDIDVWRPIASFSFALDFTISRWIGDAPSPRLFHAGNVAWHAAASALVAVLALRLGLSRAAATFACVLFAVHPIHTEAVANVYQRQELLAAAFGVAFLVAHRAGRSLVAGGLLLLALGSKESALGFVPLAIVLDLVHPRAGRRVHARAWIAPAAAVLAWWALRTQALEGVNPRPMLLENPLATASFVERVATALGVQLLYVGLIAWPAHLSSDYSYRAIPLADSFADPRAIGFVVVAGIALSAAWFLRARRPRVAVAILAYPALAIVTSNLLVPIGTIAAERLVYAPSLAACLLAAEAFEYAVERGRGRLAAVVGVLLVTAAGFATAARNRVWVDEAALFADQVVTAPNSAKAHLNLGIVLQRAGDNAGAQRALERSLAIYPENSHTWYALGIALYNQRAEPPKVITAFQNALRHGPMHHEARVKLALVLLQLGGKAEAQRVVDELARFAPDHPKLPELRARIAAAR